MELREPRLDASDPLLEARDPRLLLEDTVRELADRLQEQENIRFRKDLGGQKGTFLSESSTSSAECEGTW